MPNDAGRAGTPAGVFGAELRYYRTRAGLSQKDLASRANVSHDVISKIETGERPPAEDFPPRLDAVPDLDTRGALTRLWDHLKKGQKQRLHGWFQEWADIEAQATVLRWYEPLVVPGLLQTEEYARAILSARPDGKLDDLDEQVAARLARQAILDRTGAPQLWCILDEGVLHRAIGSSKVGLRQPAEDNLRAPARDRERRRHSAAPPAGRRPGSMAAARSGATAPTAEQRTAGAGAGPPASSGPPAPPHHWARPQRPEHPAPPHHPARPRPAPRA